MIQVLVVGTRDRLEEFKLLKLQNAEIHYLDQLILDLVELGVETKDAESNGMLSQIPEFTDFQVIFDLNLDDNPENIDNYATNKEQIVIGCAVKHSLGEMVYDSGVEFECFLFGINSLPTFINRPLLEMSCYTNFEKEALTDITNQLGLKIEIVEDRVGMVSPRIICMIINEASFVLQEGTASVPAVDQAMKLGTNYPFGPFEWADAIGLSNVMDVLEGLQRDMGEEKYKIAPLLKTRFLKEDSFYPSENT